MTKFKKNRIQNFFANLIWVIMILAVFFTVVYFANSFIMQWINQIEYVNKLAKEIISLQDMMIYSGTIFILGVACGRYIQRFVRKHDITKGINAINNEYEASMHMLKLLERIKYKGYKKVLKNFAEEDEK